MADKLVVTGIVHAHIGLCELPYRALHSHFHRSEDLADSTVAVALRMRQAQLNRQRPQRPVILQEQDGSGRVHLRLGRVDPPQVWH